MKDLFVFVADKNMEFTLKGGLERPESLGIRPITFEIRQHPGRDGGMRTSGAQIMALEASRFRNALMVFDYEGSGASESSQDLEARLDAALSQQWGDRAKAIVIEPEVDIWMWGGDQVLATILRWGRTESIREWLSSTGFAFRSDGKPERPKEALEAVFAEARRPRSSANYEKIARQISLARCTDPAFKRLQETLGRWYPVEVGSWDGRGDP